MVVILNCVNYPPFSSPQHIWQITLNSYFTEEIDEGALKVYKEKWNSSDL